MKRWNSLNRNRQVGNSFSLSITSTTASAREHAAYLKTKLRAAHRLVPQTRLRELSIALVGDSRMSELHQQFMGISGPTDVLTFPLDLDSRGRAVSGEVVVCVPEARRRAREIGTDLRPELLLYGLHGMLHLSGFDDRTDRQYHRMHRMEDQILRRLGVGPVFEPERSQKPGARSQTRASSPGSWLLTPGFSTKGIHV